MPKPSKPFSPPKTKQTIQTTISKRHHSLQRPSLITNYLPQAPSSSISKDLHSTQTPHKRVQLTESQEQEFWERILPPVPEEGFHIQDAVQNIQEQEQELLLELNDLQTHVDGLKERLRDIGTIKETVLQQQAAQQHLHS